MAFRGDRYIGIPWFKGPNRPNCLNARQRGNPVNHLSRQPRTGDAHEQNLLAFEPRIDGLNAQEAFQKQAGSGKESDREGAFRHDKCAASARQSQSL